MPSLMSRFSTLKDAPCYRSSTLAQCYHKNELENKRAYEERVGEIEHGSFSPLFFSVTRGIGPIATVVYKKLAFLLAEKQGRAYCLTLHQSCKACIL